MSSPSFEVHFRTAARRGGSLGPALRTAALADGMQHADLPVRATLVASAPPEVHDLLYMRVRNLVALPEEFVSDIDGHGSSVPDVVIVDPMPPGTPAHSLIQAGTILVERLDGAMCDDDGQPMACRIHRRDGSVRVISGEACMLLDPALPQLRAQRKPSGRPPRELLILLGAGAHPVAELRIAEELAPLAKTFERIDFVTGFHSTTAHRRQLERLLPTARIIPGALRPAALLARADIAIVAGAAVVREAAVLGTPALLLSCTDKDLTADAAFAARGSALHCGHFEALYPRKLAQLLRSLSEDDLARMAARGPEINAGNGLVTLLRELRLQPAAKPAKFSRKVSIATN